MANTVQIYNLVGTLVGTEARVTDPNDNRLLARTVRGVWDVQRRAAIRDGEFNFACRRGQLPALATPLPYGFGYHYELPAECIKFIELLDVGDAAAYRIEGREILTDYGPPIAGRWCVDVTEPALWDDQFADAFAKRLAMTCGKKIAGSAYSMAEGKALYDAAIAAAKSSDARENPPIEQEESDWILARVGGYAYDPLRWG